MRKKIQIEVESIQMKYILIKYLKDALIFFRSPEAARITRGDWIDAWMRMNLQEDILKIWLLDPLEKEDGNRFK